jgi:predicted MFS family arabinose efflux permease
MIAARHRVLALYAAWNALMQYEWLRFAPITDVTATHYHVGAGDVGLLSLLFPLLFLPLGLPTGWLIDHLSVRSLLRLGAAVMTAGAAVRIASPSFHAVVAGQFLFAAAQPLVVSLISKVVAVWFPEPERLRATSVGTMSLLLGPALAFVITPATAALPMRTALSGDLMLLVLLSMVTFLLVPADPAQSRTGETQRWLPEIRDLLKTRGYIALLGLIFIGNGYMSAVFTWLEPMLKPQNLSAEAAGLVGLLVLGGGLAGMAAVPRIPDARTRLRPLLLAALATAALLTVLLVARLPLPLLCIAAVALGALVQGPLPIIVELVTDLAGPERAGTAASGFWLSANAGAAAIIALLSYFADTGAWLSGALAMAGLLLVEALIAASFTRGAGTAGS